MEEYHIGLKKTEPKVHWNLAMAQPKKKKKQLFWTLLKKAFFTVKHHEIDISQSQDGPLEMSLD